MNDDCRTILVIAGRYPCLSETFVRREVVGLREAGWQVDVLALRTGDLPADADARYVYDGFRAAGRCLGELLSHPLNSAATFFRAVADATHPLEPTSLRDRIKLVAQALAAISSAAYARRRQISHVHCHFAHAPTTVGMYLAMHLELPFSFVGHANDLFQRRTLLARKLQRARFVSCISNWHRALYCETHRAGADKYCVIRCGVDLRSWHHAERTAGGPLHVLGVGRLVEKKGFDTLLRAVAILCRANSDLVASVTIAGDGPWRETLGLLARELEVSDVVQFKGACSPEEIRALMASASVFVLPCREDAQGDRDGIPVVLMEAMAAGVPVIAGDLPAIRELVQHGETGLLVHDHNGDDTAACLRLLASDPSLSTRLSHAAADLVRREFSSDVNIDRLKHAISGREEVVDKCLKQHSSATA